MSSLLLMLDFFLLMHPIPPGNQHIRRMPKRPREVEPFAFASCGPRNFGSRARSPAGSPDANPLPSRHVEHQNTSSKRYLCTKPRCAKTWHRIYLSRRWENKAIIAFRRKGTPPMTLLQVMYENKQEAPSQNHTTKNTPHWRSDIMTKPGQNEWTP